MLYKGRILAERYGDSELDENGAGDRKSGYFQMRQGRDQAGHSRWIDRTGAPEPLRVNPIGFATTARDLARFGLLILADGQGDDKTVVADREYLRAALRPSQEFNPAYGYLWWLNREGTRARASNGIGNHPLIRRAPPDLVAAIGAGEPQTLHSSQPQSGCDAPRVPGEARI
jgi:CubicO group peptidase (beta-lactamase class C family)